MTFKVSTALRNALTESQPLKLAMSNCVLKVYTGTQPSDANQAPTGTLLCTYSDASGALTREVLAKGTVALTGGASGSVDTLTVNSLEIMGSATSFNTSLTQTAADICTKINNNPKNQLFTAANNASATITITAKPGMGTLPNGWVVASTVTTITKTDTNMGAGGAAVAGVSPVNCLQWGDAAAGVLSKLSTQTWSGVAGNTGTAGWFRFEASVTDAGALDSSEAVLRMDGSVGTSGTELILPSTSFASSTTYSIDTFTVTLPTS